MPVQGSGAFFVAWGERILNEPYIFGTIVSPDGEASNRRGNLLYKYPPATYDGGGIGLQAEGDHFRLEMHQSVHNTYQATVLTIDSFGRVTGTTTGSASTESLGPVWTRNAAGQTLYFSNSNAAQSTTVWFVGQDGLRRHPTGLGQRINPFYVATDGDDWIVLGQGPSGIVWYRFSEETRDTPSIRSVGNPITGYAQHTSSVADGEIAVLTEEHTNASSSGSYSHDRTVSLNIVRPDGASTSYTLLPKEKVNEHEWYFPIVSLAKDGDGWIVAYAWFDGKGGRELRTWRVAGTVTKTTMPNVLDPQLATGTRNLLMFSRPRTFSSEDSYDFFVQPFDRGTLPAESQPRRLLVSSEPSQRTPSAAAAPDGSVMAAWREGDTRGDIMMRFFDALGNATVPVRISSDIWDARNPVVVHNGDTWLVAWTEIVYRANSWHDPERQKIVVRRFDAHGAPIDAEQIVLGTVREVIYGTIVGDVAAGAEANGFRVAWHGTPSHPDYSTKPVIYTTHVDARDPKFAEPEVISPVYVPTSIPQIVSSGAESVVLWSEQNQQAYSAIRGQRFLNGEKHHSALDLGPAPSSFAAAMHDGEILLATARKNADNEYCAEAQRFSLNGTALAQAVPLGCGAAADTLAVWDHDQWWVWSSGMLHKLDGDAIKFFPDSVHPLSLSLFATGLDPSAVYVRVDEGTDWIERAFLRTFPHPRSRTVRH